VYPPTARNLERFRVFIALPTRASRFPRTTLFLFGSRAFGSYTITLFTIFMMNDFCPLIEIIKLIPIGTSTHRRVSNNN
jgi:hypothetical protein